LMRPEGYTGMEVKGLKKRFKDKAFAAAVNRDEIMEAMQMAGVELESIMQFIIERQGAVK
ncbi:MAG: hydrolase, partial [Ferruginibacter sp.]